MENTISKNNPIKDSYLKDLVPNGASQQQKINKRLGEMPRVYRQVYEKAVTGGSKAAAIKAFCLECVCWQKNEIINCTACACPLFAVRPFVKREKRNKERTNR